MRLQNFLKVKRAVEPEEGCRGSESNWLEFCQFSLTGPKFLVADVSFIPSAKDGVLIKAPGGAYKAQVKCIDYRGDVRISRLRIFRKGSSPEQGSRIGATWTDTARTGWCDYEVFSKAWGNGDNAAQDKISEVLDKCEDYGTAILGPKVVMPFVTSGFGDGKYPVYELLQGKERLGFEIEFITHNTPYPFPSSPAVTVRKLRETAEQGDVEAQWQLGECYRVGDGVKQDFKAAVKWHRLAADKGHAEAAWRLGTYFGTGSGVTRDPNQAKAFYELASDRGNPAALNELGRYYSSGIACESDYKKAAKLFLQAAEKGNAEAQYNLGLAYHMGRGVQRDMEQALKWYRLAAEQDQPMAQCNLGICYMDGLAVAKDLTEAVRWFKRGAIQEHASSEYNLGYCYEKGHGASQDFEKAAAYYRRSASRGSLHAKTNLALLMKNGQGTTEDLAGAVRLLQEAADAGFAEAQYELGLILESGGKGVKRDPFQACKCFKKAASGGNKEAAEHFARFLGILSPVEKAAVKKVDKSPDSVKGSEHRKTGRRT